MGADEWKDKGKPGIQDFECFEFDPENPKKPDPKDEVSAAPAPSLPKPVVPGLAVERFASKVAHQGKLVDEEALKTELSTEEKQQEGSSAKLRFESPIDRLNRLKRQVNEFQASVGALAKTQAISSTTTEHNSVEATFGGALSASGTWPWLACQAPSTGLLESSSDADRLTHQARLAAHASDQSVSLEVIAREEQKGRMATLDHQVQAIERVVGNKTAASLNGKAMFVGLTDLLQQVEVLSDSSMDTLHRRLKDVTRELSTMDLKKGLHADDSNMSETHSRLLKLEELMDKNEPMAKITPAMDKLVAQGDEHQRAAECVLRLQRLKERQAAMIQLANDDQAALAAVTDSLKANLQVMKANIASLQQRAQQSV